MAPQCGTPFHFVHTNTWDPDTLVIRAHTRCALFGVEIIAAEASWCSRRTRIVVEARFGCPQCQAACLHHLRSRVTNGETACSFAEDAVVGGLDVTIDRSSGGMRYARATSDETNDSTAYSASTLGEDVSPAVHPPPWSKSRTPSCGNSLGKGTSL